MTKTMQQFVNKNNIRITSEWAAENPANKEWKDANHYKVTLKMNGRQMTLYFSQGYGISGEPTAQSVINCLISDAIGFENSRGFEDWAGEYGYDTDSRKAEAIYKTIERQAKKLKQFLGEKYNQIYDLEQD